MRGIRLFVAAAVLVTACSGGDSSGSSDRDRDRDTERTDETDRTDDTDSTDGGTDDTGTDSTDGGGSGTGGVEPGWLVVVYEATDNNLESAVLDDIGEMGQVDADALDLVVMIDRHDSADAAGGYSGAETAPGVPEQPGQTQLLHGGAGAMELIDAVADVNTGDPADLAAFVARAITTYPREHVALVIGDHGAAWRGVAHDEASGDGLELPEIATAVADGLAAAGRDRLDLIGFDACLMASFEVASALAPYADYLVASEEVEPGEGWDWTTLAGLDGAATDAASLGTRLVDGYANFYADESRISNQTMALLDLTAVDALSSAVVGLAAQAGQDATTAAVTLARAAIRAYGFADSPDPSRSYHQLDIGDLAETIAAQNPDLADEAEVVLGAIDAVVIRHTHGTLADQSSGISIYLPPNRNLADERYLGLTGLRPWQELIVSYLSVTVGSGGLAAFTDDDKYIEGTWTSTGFELASTYDPAADATVVDARLRYGTYDEGFTSMIFYGSDPLTFGNGYVSGVWEPQALQISDGATTAYAYSTFDISGDRSRAIISVPLEYVGPDGTEAVVDGRFVFDQAGNFISRDLVTYTDYGVGRVQVDPAGTLYPLAAVQDLDTFEQEWVRTSTTGITADISVIGVEYVPIPETTAIVAQLELHSLDGEIDLVFAGDAVPYAYYTDRSTYPAAKG